MDSIDARKAAENFVYREWSAAEWMDVAQRSAMLSTHLLAFSRHIVNSGAVRGSLILDITGEVELLLLSMKGVIDECRSLEVGDGEGRDAPFVK